MSGRSRDYLLLKFLSPANDTDDDDGQSTSISLAAARALDAVEIDGRRRNRSGRHHRRHLKITTGKHNHVSLSTYLFFLSQNNNNSISVLGVYDPKSSYLYFVTNQSKNTHAPLSYFSRKIWAILNQKLMAKNQIVFESSSSSTRREIKRNGLAHFHFFCFLFSFLLATHTHTDSTRGVGYISRTLYTGSGRAGEMYSGRPLGAFCVRHTGEHWVLYYSTPPFSLSPFGIFCFIFFRLLLLLLLLPLVRE
jgi:hypothetical protein